MPRYAPNNCPNPLCQNGWVIDMTTGNSYQCPQCNQPETYDPQQTYGPFGPSILCSECQNWVVERCTNYSRCKNKTI